MAQLSRSPAEMMGHAEHYAFSKTSKPPALTVALAMMAGLFIALGFLFYVTVTTGAGSAGWGSLRMLGGVAFSIGLILVVVCGGELFTSTVLSTIANANRQVGFGHSARIWAWVYLGNFAGALLVVALVMAAQLYQLDGGQWGLNALAIAQHKLHHSPVQAFALGVLCNLLVCLAMWMTFSTDQLLTKALLVVLPVALFVSSGFEHCVANMFMVPLGIAIHSWAPASFWQQLGVAASQYSDLGWGTFVTANLIPVTLGNIVGGSVLVGLNYWVIFRRISPLQSTSLSGPGRAQAQFSNPSIKDLAMPIKQLKVKQIMKNADVVLAADMPLAEALGLLLHKSLSGAPVLGEQGSLLGYLSLHDLLVALWCNDYRPLANKQVADLMQKPVITINGEEAVIHLAEQMAVDVEAVYPVSDQGIATAFSLKSLNERARMHKANKPHHYPVLLQGQLAGMVSRHDVMLALCGLVGERQVAVEDNRKSA